MGKGIINGAKLAPLAEIQADEDAAEILGELYAGCNADGTPRTYADELAAATSWAEAWGVLVDAAVIARASGDYLAREAIRELVGAYHAELAAGREALRA